MQIIEVSTHNLYQATQIHAISWRDSHKSFCSAEFVVQHTPQRQMEYLQRELDAVKQLFMLTDGHPVGIVSVDGNVIVKLYVLPDEQRKGYGSRLLEYTVTRCQGTPTLWIISNNVGAYHLYKNHGFEETGNHKQLRADLFELEMRLL